MASAIWRIVVFDGPKSSSAGELPISIVSLLSVSSFEITMASLSFFDEFCCSDLSCSEGPVIISCSIFMVLFSGREGLDSVPSRESSGLG